VQRRRRRAADPAARCDEPAHTTGCDSDAGCHQFALADAAWCDAHADAAGNDADAVGGPHADARGHDADADAARYDADALLNTDAGLNGDAGPHARRQAHRYALAGRDSEPHSPRHDAVADAGTDGNPERRSHAHAFPLADGNTGADPDADPDACADADVFTGRL
jgi:hypothetical protein